MSDPISASMKIAASGVAAQSLRLQIVTENLANAGATSRTPGGAPYQRQVVSFNSQMDELTGAQLVRVDDVGRDTRPFRIEHMPGHPAADADGNVKLPNVSSLIEMSDMREASRSYEANLQVIKQGRELIAMTLDLLRVG